MIIKNFVVFEGGDGSGTSTQLNLLRQRLASERGCPRSTIGFEPTDGAVGKLLRVALRGEVSLLPETVARLFVADRGEHLYGPDGVAQRSAAGDLVVSDRYVPSSLVYQGMVCGEGLPAALNAPFPKPELLFYFDIDPEIAFKRIASRATRDEFEKLETQRIVKARYDRILPEYCGTETRLVRLDASSPIEAVAENIWSELIKMPIFNV